MYVSIRSVKQGFVAKAFRNFSENNPQLYFERGSLSFLTEYGPGDGSTSWDVADIEWLDESNEDVIMGVGGGGGQHFVKGDYESIKVLQEKLFELERLRKEVNKINTK